MSQNPLSFTSSMAAVDERLSPAPPDGWTQSTALDFARQLLPASVRTESFESLPPDGATKGYEIEGYRIYLLGIGNLVFDVEVVTESYPGPRC